MNNASFSDLVAPRRVDAARLLELESLLSSCSRVLGGLKEKSGLRSRLAFYREFLRVYRPGVGCAVGSADVSPGDAALLMGVKEVEGELLGHFSLMINKSVRRRGEEFHADAYEGFFNAMLNYDGSVRFSTFLHTCLARHLSRACTGGGCVRVPDRVRRLSMRVVGRMGGGESFDSAVEGLDDKSVRRVVAAMGRVRTATDLEVGESDLFAVEDRESLEWVSQALEGVEFTVLERAALKGFMESPSGVMGLSEGMEGLVNPSTGRPYSRAAVSAAWRQAKKKIARVLEAA